jgi:ribosomal protein S18 acetylase RimI-like enzyme
MPTCFRPFKSKDEEEKAVSLIGSIDQGEKWIFQGAEGSEEFGGFIDRLYYFDEGTYGAYCACIFRGKLRIHIGFNTDMPDELAGQLLELIAGARRILNTFTSIWYVPTNLRLNRFLFHELPWEAYGHKTHELKAFPQDFLQIVCTLPPNGTIIPFDEKYTDETCSMLDRSLAHTFGDPDKGIFMANRDGCQKEWVEKAKSGDCCIMIQDGTVAGAYILKGAEIDFIAVAVGKQGRGLGRVLLLHAIRHIQQSSEDCPYLYCIDRNPDALRFYLREGMKVTGYSGGAFLQEQ